MTELAPTLPKSPWQIFYATLHGLRSRWYAKHSRRLPHPVISVGNLHWGGSGKTPLTAAIATHLRDGGRSVCILSRGYGRKGRGIRVVSVGDGPLLGPSVAGDEPVQLAGELPGVSVVVGVDRYEAGQHALERVQPAPEIFVLDDGFSHLQLARDLDLLAFPADDCFGNGRLFPSGRLREPLSSSARADAVILTGAESESASELSCGLRPFGFVGPSFTCRTRILAARWARQRHDRLVSPGTRLVAVAAVAHPQSFLRSAAECGAEIVETLTFPDHHHYSISSLSRIEAAVGNRGAEGILTTVKDGVKLRGRLDVAVAELPIRAEPEADFWVWLDRELARIELA